MDGSIRLFNLLIIIFLLIHDEELSFSHKFIWFSSCSHSPHFDLMMNRNNFPLIRIKLMPIWKKLGLHVQKFRGRERKLHSRFWWRRTSEKLINQTTGTVFTQEENWLLNHFVINSLNSSPKMQIYFAILWVFFFTLGVMRMLCNLKFSMESAVDGL